MKMLGLEKFLYNQEWTVEQIEAMVIGHIINHDDWSCQNAQSDAINGLVDVLRAYTAEADEDQDLDIVYDQEAEELFIQNYAKAFGGKMGKDEKYGRESYPLYDFPIMLKVPRKLLIKSAQICGYKDAEQTLWAWDQIKEKEA
jgi:hypothetical protein